MVTPYQVLHFTLERGTYEDADLEYPKDDVKRIGKDGPMGIMAEALRNEGRVEGLAEGKGKSLMRLLECRLDPLPRDAQEWIAAANLDQLNRVLNAESQGVVFGD